MIVNHVMSSDAVSGIFEDIMNYFKTYASQDDEIIVSNKPVDNADIYHYHRPHLEKELKPNSICTVHHDLDETDHWLDYEKFHNIYQSSQLVVCLNSNQVNYLKNRGIEHTVVIPHGYNDGVFNKSSSINMLKKKEKITLGVIAKRYGRKVKGEEYLYELAKKIDANVFDFILVGDGRSIDAKILRDYGFNVTLYEYLPYRIFGSLYREIDALLMLSLHEGGPANIPEAVVTGTPIIGNDIGMVSDYVINGYNGYLLSSDLNDDLVIFDELKNNIQRLKTNSFHVRSKAKTWKNIVDIHFQEYSKVIEAGK
ncbi:glycosyltransferase family 4 protein [Cobetia sp. 1CM21F]|uniref:glycosyltransferase family 4 protein n=1 Tax=Cobetia sp. 1CM21F TaxID=2929163 RepID=UPI0020C14A34|nr:glycosyltransferase family 4 protein [Cobetia sp. 1CM21F]MCK8066948.1 glycosyltransferase family 4 protein [Cobetia sp. 1CM21F]